MASDNDLKLMDRGQLLGGIRPHLAEAADDTLREVLELLLKKVKKPDPGEQEKEDREHVERFADQLPRGTTVDDILAGLKAERKIDPKLKASDYIA